MSGIWNLNLYRDLSVAFTGIVSRFTVSSSTPYRSFSLERARRDRNVPNFMPFLKILHNSISSHLLNVLDPSLLFNYQPIDNDITD